MYDRSLSTEKPVTARGNYDLRGDQQGHSTQVYGDNTRVSWDTDGQGDSNQHWTDQNIQKGHRGRHNPPPHAR